MEFSHEIEMSFVCLDESLDSAFVGIVESNLMSKSSLYQFIILYNFDFFSISKELIEGCLIIILSFITFWVLQLSFFHVSVFSFS